jgi:replicative DNA helicase
MTTATINRDDEVARLRVPPHSTEAEQGVLGALLMDNRTWDRVGDLLSATDFYRHEHRTIYEAIGGLVNANKPADLLTVFDRLTAQGRAEEVGGLSYLNDLAQSVPSASHAHRYAEIVRERAVRRTLISIGDEVASMGFQTDEDLSEQVDRAAGLLSALTAGQVKEAPVRLSDLALRAIDRITELSEGRRTPAISTGIPPLDRVLNGGLRGAKLYGLAARPSVGKSSLARAIGRAVARQQVPTLLLSQEMGDDEVTDCVLSEMGGIESTKLQTGKLEDADWGRLVEAVQEASELPLYIDDQGSLTLSDIRNKARMVRNCGCVILDYLQLSRSTLKGATTNDQVAEISKGLKALSMSLGIPVIVLSQLNRDVEKRADKEPQLSDLRDSGAIEQDLDVAIMLWTYREFDDGARRIVGCKVPKHRGGPKGRFALEFKASTYRWYESEASLDGPTRIESRAKGFE